MRETALRRSFAFIELHSECNPVEQMWARCVVTQRLQDDRAGLLRRLNAVSWDHDAGVGPSLLMRYLDDSGIADVCRDESVPFLTEYHYSDRGLSCGKPTNERCTG